MQPESTHAPRNIPTQQDTPITSPTPHYGQRRDNDLPDSLQPHSSEPRGEPQPLSSGTERDETRSGLAGDDGDTMEAIGLKCADASTPPPRDRITEYENARVKSPSKPSEGPLFEVVKVHRKPDDKNCPITKLPNGEFP
jgi:hypothetical protein